MPIVSLYIFRLQLLLLPNPRQFIFQNTKQQQIYKIQEKGKKIGYIQHILKEPK
jgi:hypothetical protein